MAEELEQHASQDSQETIARLNEALDTGMLEHVRKMLSELRPSDIAHILESTPHSSREIIWELVDHDAEGEILQNLNEEVRNNFAEQMQPNQLAEVISGLDTDDLADVIGDFRESIKENVLKLLDEQNRKRVEQALSFPEDTAGGLMNTDTITVKPHVTVEVVLRYLRMRGELPSSTDSLYVVDGKDRLLGTVPLAALVTSEPELLVTNIVDSDLESIDATVSDKEVALLFERNDWVTAPVVDENGSLIGRITIDDVVDVIREEAEHSLMSMAGLDEDADTFAPVWSSFKRRAVWLGINLITVLVAAKVIGIFENTIQIVTALAILLPIVPSMGGIAGTQTLTLVIRGQTLGQLVTGNTRWFLMKELGVSVLNGVLWATVVGVVAYFWFADQPQVAWLIALAVGIAMQINLVVGALTGALLPLVMKRMNMDPVLSGGVVLTTVTDVVGNLSFLGIATLFFA